MGASVRPEQQYSPDNPFAQKALGRPSYSSDNPFANEQMRADMEGIRPKGGAGNIDLRKDLNDLRGQQHPAHGGVLAPLAQGATLGFADEILGGIGAANSMLPEWMGGEGRSVSDAGDAYRRGRDKVRGFTKQYAKENPKTSIIAELIGGVIPAVGGGVASTAGKGLLAKMGIGAAEGAGFGGAAGAGYSEGESVGEIAGDAARSGIVGGILGGTIPAVATGAGKVGRGALDVIGKRTASAPVRATQKIVEALERDQITVPELRAKLAKAGNKPVSLVDLAGENTVGLARAAQAVPSKAKQAVKEGLEARQSGRFGRVVDDIEAGVGQERQNIYDTAEQLSRSRKASAKKLYDAAYEHGPVDDPEIRKALELPAFQRAFKRGQRIAKLEGVELPNDVLAIAKGNPPTVQELDYMKRGLDDVIESGFRRGSIGKTEARALKDKLRSVLERVDAQVPAYGQARAKYAGDTDIQEALQAGKNFLKEDSRKSAKEIARMTPGERDMYRVGGLDAIRSYMDNGGDFVRDFLKKPERRAQVREMLDDDRAFARLEDALSQEGAMAKAEGKVLGNSVTARAQSEIADLANTPADRFVADVAQGDVKSALTKRVLSALDRRRQGVAGRVADELSSKLTAGAIPGTTINDLLAEIERGPGQTRAQQTASSIGPVLRRLLGEQAGAAVARP